MRTAAILVIGNEILSGKIAEGNVHGLAKALRSAGVLLKRVVTVLDDPEVIAGEVTELSASHDVVFTSGGVGPTHDDVTIASVAHAFGVNVVSEPKLEALLRRYYGEKITPGHLLMARVPEGCRLVASEAVPWPTPVMKNVWMLPGVPEIFAMKIPLIVAEIAGDAPFLSAAVYTTLDEGQIKDALDATVARFADVEIGSYPVWHAPEYKTKLTFDGKAEDRVLAARDDFASAIPKESIVKLEG